MNLIHSEFTKYRNILIALPTTFIASLIFAMFVSRFSFDRIHSYPFIIFGFGLFCIILGYTLAKIQQRNDEFILLTKREDVIWLGLYEKAKKEDLNMAREILALIDSYYSVLMHPEWYAYYKEATNSLQTMYHIIEKYQSVLGDKKTLELLNEFKRVMQVRAESKNAFERRITPRTWQLLTGIVALVILALALQQTSTVLSLFISSAIITIFVVGLLTLRDTETFRISVDPCILESGQGVFDSLGLLRYYSQEYLDHFGLRVPKSVNKYRLGIHKLGQPAQVTLVDNNIKTS